MLEKLFFLLDNPTRVIEISYHNLITYKESQVSQED